MPELPEVETTRRGIAEHVCDINIDRVMVHNPSLRWPVPVADLHRSLPGNSISTVTRRAKYLLFTHKHGCMIIHLGMSGSLRIVDSKKPRDKHDHFEIQFSNGRSLRLRDPRRFGAVLWTSSPPAEHKLLASLGPEPLGDDFHAEYLFRQTRKRRCTIKSLVMDSQVVVGVGNIYASEALFRAGIRPGRQASRLTRKACAALVDEIKQVLADAIAVGGTTLRDFTDSDGNSGYFSLSLSVYGREGELCAVCGATIRSRRIAQRSSFYCPNCQK